MNPSPKNAAKHDNGAHVDNNNNADFSGLGAAEFSAGLKNQGVRSYELVTEVSGIDQAELMQNFALLFARALDECRGYDINSGPPGLPQVLRDVVSNELNRNVAWGALAVAGLPKNLNQAQGHALVVGLLPHLSRDGLLAQGAVCRIAQDATKQRDYDLYRALGEGCSATPMHPIFLNLLTVPFCQFLCHNVQHDKALQMWSDVISEQADEQPLRIIALEMRDRVFQGQLSSYDHLLTTLCNARNRSGLKMIAELIEPVQPRPEMLPTPPVAQKKFLSGEIVQSAVALSTIGILCTVIDLQISPTAGVVAAFAGGALWGLYTIFRQKREQPRETVNQEQEEYFNGRSHNHFSERLYQKLVERAPVDRMALDLQRLMDANPRYAHLKDTA